VRRFPRVGPSVAWLVRGLCLLLLTGLLSPAPAQADPVPGPPGDVGFSFSPKVAADMHLDPVKALGELLKQLHPDLVRLPVFWDDVAPTPETLDFSSPDALLRAVHAYNRADRLHRHTQVMLVVGARNLGTPEVHVPAWAEAGDVRVRDVTQTPEYQRYLEGTFTHYGKSTLLRAWQVENEPLDNTNAALGDVSLPRDLLAGEIDRLKAIDPVHQMVVTTYDSATLALDKQANSIFRWLWNLLPGPRPAGHPMPALQLGDVLGLDIYVVTPSTPLQDAGAVERIDWKATAVDYWAKRATAVGKQLWITEMEGAPWDGVDGFTPEDLLYSAQAYRHSGVGAVLLWGVESWLDSPDWMATGQEALEILRS
jgi:hypothetical protein